MRNGALQVRTACKPEVCTALTDTASLNVTRLESKLQCTVQSGWLYRRILVLLEAQWPQDATRTARLQRSVVLRNAVPQAFQTRYCP